MLRRPGWGGYLEFLLLATGAAALLAGLGSWVVSRLDRADDTEALVTGCTVGWLAAVVGALVIARAGPRGVAPQRILAATALRLVVAAALAGLVLAVGGIAAEPLILWTGISYLALLPLDTIYALRRAAGQEATEESNTETS